jgi:hypothetical protein
MTTWTGDQLARISAADNLNIQPARGDGTLRDPVPIWVVRDGEDLYVRSSRATAAPGTAPPARSGKAVSRPAASGPTSPSPVSRTLPSTIVSTPPTAPSTAASAGPMSTRWSPR